ncbi:MAG: SpoIIE family protein phosphatase [Candidatus Poribacteria bacterium]|nr:SpoIIE family protein phosphatase [Candidatus Poribacteria bacterium]
MYRISKFLYIILIVFCLVLVQSSDAFQQMKSYTVADGLVGPVVPVIFQDSRGVLWFGSDRGGVSRFDGNTFTPYTGDTVGLRGRTTTIVEDKWGHIWFLSKHPAEGTGVIKRFNGESFDNENRGTCLAVDNFGDIWIGGNNILTKHVSINSQEDPQPYSLPISSASVAKVNVIFQSRDGTYWIGGSDAQGALIMSFLSDTNVWQVSNLQRKDNLPNLPKDRSVQIIIQDSMDNLWFGGHSLLLRYDGTQFHNVLENATGFVPQGSSTPSDNLNRKDNVSVRNDIDGRIWYSDNKQIWWWNGNKLQRMKNLRSGTVQDNYLQGYFEIEDAWKKLWFASETGTHVYDSKIFEQENGNIFELDSPITDTPDLVPRVYGVDDGLGSDNILTIFESLDGKIWFGHDNGVTSFEPQPVIVNHTTRERLGSNSVRMIDSDSTGTLWFSIPGGIAKYTENDDILVHYSLTDTNEEQSENRDIQSSDHRTEINKIFEVDRSIWFLDKPIQHEDAYTLYRLFSYRNDTFDKITVQVSAKIGPGGEPIHHDTVPYVSSKSNPWIILGGWIILPRSNGLYTLSPEGDLRFYSLGSTVSLPSPSAAVSNLYIDNTNRLWSFLDKGEVKRYSNIRINGNSVGGNIHTETLPLRSVVPILGDSDFKTIKWYYNSISGQLMYWEDPDSGNTLTEIPGAASGFPLHTVQTPSSNQQSSERMTFVFQDGIKTYDGTELINAVSIELDNIKAAITSQNGSLWLATSQGAVQYTGEEVIKYSITDGFLVDDIRDVHEDHWGNVWFATWGGGVVSYDGNSFQSLTTKDGLIHNNVSSIHASAEKDIWFGTEGGATQYRARLGALPFCRIVSIDAGKSFTEPFLAEMGKRTFTRIEELLPARLKQLSIYFQGINPLRDDLEYKFRLIGIDNYTWQTVTSDIKQYTLDPMKGVSTQSYTQEEVGSVKTFPEIRFEGLKSGKYTFLIKAFREGWPYTLQPAVLHFTIDQPIWSRWRKFLPTIIFVAAVGSLLFRLIVNRRHTAQLRLEMQEKEEAEMLRIRAELNEAQNIQTALLPTEPPNMQMFDIAGMSIPATQVGGDFFDYLTVSSGQTAIAVADAAGKGIRGAMNAVLTNGMLHEVARFKSDADVILTDLNAGLSPRMYGPSFIALNLAVLYEAEKKVDYANGGQPYPILKRGTDIIEIENSDLPLGSMQNVQYESVSLDLREGDVLIFHSDGLIEALNANHDMYGTERLTELVSQIPEDLSAEQVIQHIVDDVQAFVQDEEQYDDLTIVVVKYIEKSE